MYDIPVVSLTSDGAKPFYRMWQDLQKRPRKDHTRPPTHTELVLRCTARNVAGQCRYIFMPRCACASEVYGSVFV